jgi:TRAP-type uncharacterized transport system substrate-binding protein
MPAGLPHRPPLAMRLWLARRSRGKKADSSSAATSRSSGRTMSIGSLEHMVRNRVRMFLRHTWLVTILGTVVLGCVIWAAVYYTTQATVMRIAAGPPGSANAKLVDVLTKVLGRGHDNIKLQLIPTDSAKDSAQALTHGAADLAIVPTTVGRSPDWPVVAILRQNVMAFIVPPPSAIAAPAAPTPAASTPAAPSSAANKGAGTKNAAPAKAATPAATPAAATPAKSKTPAKSASAAKSKKSKKSAKGAKGAKDDDSDDSDDSDASGDSDDAGKLKVKQLAGKRIAIVTGSEASADLLNAVLNHYGVPLASVQELPIDPNNLADAIHNNTVDVVFVAGAATGKAISDAVAAASHQGDAPTFIEIDQADGISKRNPAFDSIDIDAGTFGGNPPSPGDDFKSLSFAEYLVARKSFSHSGIAELAKIIYTSRLAIASQMAGEIKIEAPSTDKDADALVHQGALDYLGDNQQSFFDKYGDDIFYGMLIFPVFGSAIAGVAGYLRRDSRTRRLRLLQRVLDLIRKVHGAQSLEAIEQLQIEADHLVISIIHLSEHEEFDETIRMSFSFALEQLRFAIAARRTAIVDHVAIDTKALDAKALDAKALEAKVDAKTVAAA